MPHLKNLTLECVTPIENDTLPILHPLPNVRSLILISYEPEHFQVNGSLMRRLSCLESLVFGRAVSLNFANFEPFMALFINP